MAHTVYVGSAFTFGKRCRVWAPNSLSIGNSVSLGSNVRVEVDGRIGDFVLIASNVGIIGRLDHDIGELGTPTAKSSWVGVNSEKLSFPVQICDDVWIGYGATILSGVTIGLGAVIGAGSVVTRDIPENVIAAGNPARIIRNRFSESDFEIHKRKILEHKEAVSVFTKALPGRGRK